MLNLKFTLIAFLLAFSAIAQDNSSVIIDETANESAGTFQIVMLDSRLVEPAVTESLISQINSVRTNDTVVYIELNEFVRVRVLPTTIIESVSFEPLELYSYE